METSEAPSIEVGLPEGRDLEDLAVWVAEAVDDYADQDGAIDADAAEEVRQVARALRVLGWMVGVAGDRRRDVQAEASLTTALMRAFDLLAPPSPESGVRRKLEPLAPIEIPSIAGAPSDGGDFDTEEVTVVGRAVDLTAQNSNRDVGDLDPDEETVVKRARVRSTNRILR
jgi:hypothetical protein